MQQGITVLYIGLTLGAYGFSKMLAKKFPSPLTTPVFFSTITLIALFLLFGVSYENYGPAKEVITFFLGPATVALAVPLYKNRKILFRHMVPVLAGIAVGTVTTMALLVVMMKGFHLPDELIVSLSAKSVTAPIAVEISRMMGGDPSLTAVFVVFTGMIGAMFGQWLLHRTGIHDPLSRGLALGTISHGIGTAQIATEGELPASVSGIAMGISAVLTSALAPWIVPYFL